MCHEKWCAVVLLLSATCVFAAGKQVTPTTTLAAQTANNTSAANGFSSQTNGNVGAGNVSKVDVHSLLYSGASSKIYAHLMLWFGGSNHMNVGYSSTDSKQVRRQINDMVSRGIDGVILDWYGKDSTTDQAAKLVMAEAETHPGFTFAIMVDQGAIKWDSCSGCDAQAALISHLQYIEQTYFPSPAYMTLQGKPMVTNFDIDLSYSVDWNAVNAALATNPAFLFQNSNGFTHVLSDGSYSWVMPTTSDYGMSYLTDFYQSGIPLLDEQTVGASYKGFNDTLASWSSNRVMGQRCGKTWLKTFTKINGLYNSGNQLSALQLVTWNDYEEGTEIESGISNCLSLSISVSGNTLRWTVTGDESTVDHYVPYFSTDGKNLTALGNLAPGISSTNLCSYTIANGDYTFYVQAVGKPSITNQMSGKVIATLNCSTSGGSGSGLILGTHPSSMTIVSGGSGNVTVTAAPESGSFNDSINLTCSAVPKNLSCSFSPKSVTPGAGSAKSVFTIRASSAVASDRGNRGKIFLANGLWGLGLFGIVAAVSIQRKRMVAVMTVCAIAIVVAGTVSCGRNSIDPNSGSGPTRNNYVVTVNGKTRSVQVSTTISITVE